MVSRFTLTGIVANIGDKYVTQGGAGIETCQVTIEQEDQLITVLFTRKLSDLPSTLSIGDLVFLEGRLIKDKHITSFDAPKNICLFIVGQMTVIAANMGELLIRRK